MAYVLKRLEAVSPPKDHGLRKEIVAEMELEAGLLSNAWSALSYFALMLGKACKISNSHQALTPLLERFVSEVLFERPVDLYSGAVDHRMRDTDVIEHIRATFTPLILEKTVSKKTRKRISKGQRLSTWKPFQATSNDKRPALPAQRTMFNLVPCDNDFEQTFVDFLEYAGDVVAFAKNAGPQKLMIDYLKPDGHRALYVPDFFVRVDKGDYYLVELKGRQDPLVPLKAAAAVEWCKGASTGKTKWHYLYVPYSIFSQSSAGDMEELARACETSLNIMLKELKTKRKALSIEKIGEVKAETTFQKALEASGIEKPHPKIENEMRQAVGLLDYAVRSRQPSYAHAFQPLLLPLDEYALRFLQKHLKPLMPTEQEEIERFFNPHLDHLEVWQRRQLEKNQRYLKGNLVYGRYIQRLGVLLFCLDYAQKGGWGAEGVWSAVAKAFSSEEFKELYGCLEKVNKFRNKRVAHVEEPLTDSEEAWNAMYIWLGCLDRLVRCGL